MRVPEKYYDEIFDFRGQWDVPSRCGLRIVQDGTPNDIPAVIVTELYQDNPGTSVTAAGESLALQICAAKNLSSNGIRYIQCSPGTDSKLSFYAEEFFEVDFSAGPAPAYRQLTPAEIKQLFPQGMD